MNKYKRYISYYTLGELSLNNFEFCLNIAQISTGFIEIPNQVSLNIYAQGCKKRCKNCHNPELQSFSGGHKIYLNDVKNIVDEYNMADIICWLGGDIVYQCRVEEFNKEFKKFGKKICMYTGINFEQIDQKILDTVDVIVDGEYVEDYGPVQSGNTNQRIWIKDGFWKVVKNWDLFEIMMKESVNFKENILKNKGI